MTASIKNSIALVATSALLMAGCASQQKTTSAPASTASGTASTASSTAAPAGTRIVKSRDGRFEGEMVGTPAPGSKFAKLQIGMELNEVTKLIGGFSSMETTETGKRWIPFYFGNDVRRIQAAYAGEGCLTFTGGNVYGGGGNELVRITVDARGICAD